jgi:hypothetical protein
VTDDGECAKTASVTLTTSAITPTIEATELTDCDGSLKLTGSATGFESCSFTWKEGSTTLGTGATLNYVPKLDGICHRIDLTATCGPEGATCTGTASTTICQCVRTTVGCTAGGTCPNPTNLTDSVVVGAETADRGGRNRQQDQLEALEAGEQDQQDGSGGGGGQGGGGGKPEKDQQRGQGGGGGKPEKDQQQGGGPPAEKQQGGGPPEKDQQRGQGGGPPEKDQQQGGGKPEKDEQQGGGPPAEKQQGGGGKPEKD